MKTLSNDTIKGLMPPFSRSSSKGSSHSNSPPKESRPSSKKVPSDSRTFEGVGHCHVHPEVQLAIRRTTKGDGKWEIVKDSCPHCPAISSCNQSRRSSKTSGYPKLHKSAAIHYTLNDASKHIQPLTPESPKKATYFTGDYYFSQALVVYNGESNNVMSGEIDNANVADKSDIKQNWKVLPNSTARMARTDSRKKMRERSLRRHQKANYEAWESLPVLGIRSWISRCYFLSGGIMYFICNLAICWFTCTHNINLKNKR